MNRKSLAVTIVNHAAIDIAAPAEAVWQTILDEYVEATKFRELGYGIEPLDDPAAPLGGYRMRLEQEGAVVDDRVCRFTERDEAAHRLSIAANYLSMPGGMTVYVTYHAADAAGGTRYHLDCHSTLSIDQPADADRADVATVVAGMTDQYHAALSGYLESIKARLENHG